MSNEQEKYWAANNEYHRRSPGNVGANIKLFRAALACAEIGDETKIVELGCGTGANLKALNHLWSKNGRLGKKVSLTGVEINSEAIKQIPSHVRVVQESVLDWEPDDAFDIVITKGLLIHIAPDDLGKVYETIIKASKRYILVCEYFCPTPRMIPYRGEDDKLWARDFGGELIDQYGLTLVNYGFVSPRDTYPQDDLTWMLLEKRQAIPMTYCERCERSVVGRIDQGDLLCPNCSLVL